MDVFKRWSTDSKDANDFKSFKYKAKLLENTEADWANEILKNATIAVPLKYLSNFWWSLEMPLINCKVEFKLTKYCVLSAAGADNANADSNNIIFTIKDTKLCFCYNIISKRQSKTIRTF